MKACIAPVTQGDDADSVKPRRIQLVFVKKKWSLEIAVPSDNPLEKMVPPL